MRWPRGAAPDAGSRRRGPAEIPEGFDGDLYARLVSWRAAVAQANSRPAYTVFHDRTLKAVAARAPEDPDGLAALPGIGPAKLEVYGPSLLALVRGEEAEVPVL